MPMKNIFRYDSREVVTLQVERETKLYFFCTGGHYSSRWRVEKDRLNSRDIWGLAGFASNLVTIRTWISEDIEKKRDEIRRLEEHLYKATGE